MPRRPGEQNGDEEKIEAAPAAGHLPAPPDLLAVHYHTGSLAAAPLHPNLKALLKFWAAKRGDRAMPRRTDLPVYDLKPWFGYLAILEPVPGTFRFRLGGTELIGRFGREVTGLTLAGIAPDLRKALTGQLDLATAKQAPVAAATVLRFEGRRTLWSELALPLAGGRAGPAVMLLGSYPMKPP
jgi:hypothetical protein